MDKQEIQNAVTEFLKSEQGAALMAESLCAHLSSADPALNSEGQAREPESKKELVDDSGHELVLSRRKILDLAYGLALRHGDGVDYYVYRIFKALDLVNQDPTPS